MESRNDEHQLNPELTAIDLFCGAGGFSLGLEWAEFRILAALDNDRAALETYRHHFGEVAIDVDATLTTVDQLRQKTGAEHRDITVVVGGPPCQGFSFQRRGDRDDERNHLVKVFLDLALQLRPRFFIIENVLGLMSRRGRDVQRYVEEVSAIEGYVCHTAKLNAAAFAVPQNRWRVFMVGERLDSGIGFFRFPEPDCATTEYVTVRESLRDLPSPPANGASHPDYWNHFRETKLSVVNQKRIASIPEGGGREHLPPNLRLPCHVNNKKHRHLDVYGRLAWDQPSVTITARFDSFTRGRFGHPAENRSLTLREGARLQSFPDWFRFFGNREEIARQIGNAVPPLVAKRLGYAIQDAIHRRIFGDQTTHRSVASVQYSLI